VTNLKEPLLDWNEFNLIIVIKSIKRNLSPDLLPKKFRKENESNPMYGHCHNASGCLYTIFRSKNLHMYRALDKFGIYHWWVQDNDDNIIDITESQYSLSEINRLHKIGKKSSILGFDYKKRVETLFNRVIEDLGIKL
jgi:hypothetical protein